MKPPGRPGGFFGGRMSEALKLLISPLVGEMPGRAEGGAKDRRLSAFMLRRLQIV